MIALVASILERATMLAMKQLGRLVLERDSVRYQKYRNHAELYRHFHFSKIHYPKVVVGTLSQPAVSKVFVEIPKFV